ncbi:hypothetical protein TraAM80_06343 [Trypanosoma rangeli]|uniref:Uncharacterized protein n=1 Tax=Trypanosoma rangeli TaxID=5698 RepID=A0A3R7RH02_TRYRA|nr:uncharacterized protein TraAM80_06343 [Trypanosoma rangeli]RNF02518.1 hypothetical protein TraAM80_06343 [Trypanosoma rangeli]|eukprot:RNF02518.1 hypothetical protein TraAM80_06343 [Trypanosoma rangeli]
MGWGVLAQRAWRAISWCYLREMSADAAFTLEDHFGAFVVIFMGVWLVTLLCKQDSAHNNTVILQRNYFNKTINYKKTVLRTGVKDVLSDTCIVADSRGTWNTFMRALATMQDSRMREIRHLFCLIFFSPIENRRGVSWLSLEIVSWLSQASSKVRLL